MTYNTPAYFYLSDATGNATAVWSWSMLVNNKNCIHVLHDMLGWASCHIQNRRQTSKWLCWTIPVWYYTGLHAKKHVVSASPVQLTVPYLHSCIFASNIWQHTEIQAM